MAATVTSLDGKPSNSVFKLRCSNRSIFCKVTSKHNSRKGNAESLVVLEGTVSSARAQVTTCVSFCACFLQTRRNSSYIEGLASIAQ